jgi:hypothetical protein
MELYLHFPNTPSWRGAQLKHRDNFTFFIVKTTASILTTALKSPSNTDMKVTIMETSINDVLYSRLFNDAVSIAQQTSNRMR